MKSIVTDNKLINFHNSFLNGEMQIFVLYITGHLNIILPLEHQKEFKRYVYNHQVTSIIIMIYIFNF